MADITTPFMPAAASMQRQQQQQQQPSFAAFDEPSTVIMPSPLMMQYPTPKTAKGFGTNFASTPITRPGTTSMRSMMMMSGGGGGGCTPSPMASVPSSFARPFSRNHVNRPQSEHATPSSSSTPFGISANARNPYYYGKY